MQVLVTGAAGFIGSALIERLLARGDSVIGIDNCNAYYDPALKAARVARLEKLGGSFAFHKLDFADMTALETALADHQIDRIVHLGAQAGVRYSLENPAAYIQSNLVGHANMLEIARRRSVAHMVYASSSSVYGGNDKVPFSVDDRADHPVSLYAATKRADEMLSESYAHLYRIPLTGLRFFTVYGEWGRPDMAYWIFTRKILAGEPIPVFHKGEMWRDFTYIDDIIAGVLAVLDSAPADDGAVKAGGSSKPHALYNIGNNRSEKLTDLVAILEEACGMKAQIDWQPMQPGDVVRTYADIDAISRDLGYTPTTDIADGLPRFVEWYRHYHQG
ncbi:NAD-dependent epimerase/dehydratase family protein [Aurantiacibacter zhengii]|uniref:NAD-dependent epimerase/dehydratase family protein n=1 Tax=Aurantiacibacter zhengii TaxID=2307003 RepID=A0A418NP79_9SPHN|nr:NAD-dependent epimerase/dehydratase family protein [Aurantiacibacter zhengii]RIV83674.1 NAD-dependent epimerase/dehydratase family protein [Aurantiacibacter zhengii]